MTEPIGGNVPWDGIYVPAVTPVPVVVKIYQ
jgi:hypothetical protein